MPLEAGLHHIDRERIEIEKWGEERWMKGNRGTTEIKIHIHK